VPALLSLLWSERQRHYARLAVLAETNEIIFASYFVQTPSNISRLDLGTGQATTVNVNPPIGNAGGASSYNGQVT